MTVRRRCYFSQCLLFPKISTTDKVGRLMRLGTLKVTMIVNDTARWRKWRYRYRLGSVPCHGAEKKRAIGEVRSFSRLFQSYRRERRKRGDSGAAADFAASSSSPATSPVPEKKGSGELAVGCEY